jgi:SAM-dependent methyltransferase
MARQNELERIREVYDTVYRPDPGDRAYVWHPCNSVSVYYRQAQERALIALFNDHDIALQEVQVLDIGCGAGGFLRFLAGLGAQPGNLHGVDLMPYRIKQGRTLSPASMDLQIGNAEVLPYPDQRFDLVSQFTVFTSILDDQMQRNVAGEMTRVLKQGGYVLWYDFRKGSNLTTRGVEVDKIRQLFPTYTILALRGLHPPRASSIARRSWFLCELWDRVPGLKKTHYLALLQRTGDDR